jgi:hypothetical protein
MVSVPWSKMLSMLLDPMGVLMTARGVGLGGTSRVEVGQGVAVCSGGSAPASQNAAADQRLVRGSARWNYLKPREGEA